MAKVKIILLVTLWPASAGGARPDHDQVMSGVFHGRASATLSYLLVDFAGVRLGLRPRLGWDSLSVPALRWWHTKVRARAFRSLRLWPMVLGLVGIMAILALVAGIAGYSLSRLGVSGYPSGLSFAIPQSRHDRFMAVWFAHGASYLTSG